MKSVAELREQLVAVMAHKKMLSLKRIEIKSRMDKDLVRLSSTENDMLADEARILALAKSIVEASQREKAETLGTNDKQPT